MNPGRIDQRRKSPRQPRPIDPPPMPPNGTPWFGPGGWFLRQLIGSNPTADFFRFLLMIRTIAGSIFRMEAERQTRRFAIFGQPRHTSRLPGLGGDGISHGCFLSRFSSDSSQIRLYFCRIFCLLRVQLKTPLPGNSISPCLICFQLNPACGAAISNSCARSMPLMPGSSVLIVAQMPFSRKCRRGWRSVICNGAGLHIAGQVGFNRDLAFCQVIHQRGVLGCMHRMPDPLCPQISVACQTDSAPAASPAWTVICSPCSAPSENAGLNSSPG